VLGRYDPGNVIIDCLFLQLFEMIATNDAEKKRIRKIPKETETARILPKNWVSVQRLKVLLLLWQNITWKPFLWLKPLTNIKL